jgi:hypothetical protein
MQIQSIIDKHEGEILEYRALSNKTVDGFHKLRDKVYKEISDRTLPIIKERHGAYFKSYF